MNFVLDLPNSESVLDAGRFTVRGWFWAGDQQANAAAVEAWSGDRLLGETREFTERVDVVAALRLAPPAVSLRPGFDFFINYPAVAPGEEFDLCLRVRWSDGSRTETLATARLRSMDVGMPVARATGRSAIATHEARVAPLAVRTSSEQRDFGIEIGAFKTPIPAIKPYYFDRFPEYDYEPVKADYVADAETLPIHSHSLDYLANANVFEHLANPVAALRSGRASCGTAA